MTLTQTRKLFSQADMYTAARTVKTVLDTAATFKWVTHETVPRIVVEPGAGAWVHDEAFHASMEDGRRWCATALHVLSYDSDTIHVAPGPYCTNTTGLWFSFVLTLDKGRKVVVSRRSEVTRHGGMWSVSVDESAEVDEVGTGSPTWGTVIRRGMMEELGLARTKEAWTSAHTVIGTYATESGIGIGVHVNGSKLGVSTPEVHTGHRHASGGWEVDPVVVGLHPAALDCVAPSSQWVPGALPLLYAVAASGRNAG